MAASEDTWLNPLQQGNLVKPFEELAEPSMNKTLKQHEGDRQVSSDGFEPKAGGPLPENPKVELTADPLGKRKAEGPQY